MSAGCCQHEQQGPEDRQRDPRYRRVLWAALGINAAMFLIEIVAGLTAGSASLQADALDFLGDTANYSSFAALAANVMVFMMLWASRDGDANMRSVWLCSRNDVIGNCAVLLAALGVFGTGTMWPDIIVAAVMALLALQGAVTVMRQSLLELHQPAPVRAPAE